MSTEGRPLLVFLNEVAGGRKLLAAAKERAGDVPFVAVAAPQNQPAVGQLIDAGELRDAARARVEVTMSILSEYGIDSVGEVMDPEPSLALDDAVRAHEPGEVLLSCLYDTRFGFTRKDLVEWAKGRFEPETTVTHIPVRIEEDAISWEVNHTLVVATKTIAAPDLVERLKERAAGHPHRYTIVCPRAEDVSEAEIVRDLASTLAELYRADRGSTLRAYHRHQVNSDFLERLGEQDLTAHVNFTQIRAAGEAAGLRTETIASQSQFLTGILAAVSEQTERRFGSTWKREFQTLTHPEHLGRAFQVLVQSRLG